MKNPLIRSLKLMLHRARKETNDKKYKPPKLFKPPEKVSKQARYGLQLRRSLKRKTPYIGLDKSKDLRKRTPISIASIDRIHAYMESHEETKDRSDYDRVSWLLRGGDAGRDWVKSIKNKQE